MEQVENQNDLTQVKQFQIELEDNLKQAEEYKTSGNDCFKQLRYDESIKYYTKAIELNIQGTKGAIYYSNRAQSNIKLDNFGLALEDAKEAIKLDPKYAKAYYRQADAFVALSKYKEAKESLQKVVIELKIKDKDVVEKYNYVKKVIKQQAFADAIMCQDVDENIDYNNIDVESSYNGPIFDEEQPISHNWVVKLMEHLKDQKKLHRKYIIMLLYKVKDILKEQCSLVDFNYPEDQFITVCGDTHGQYYDMLSIFKQNGNPTKENPYLFNGDFVDRGSFSVEVILTLLAWKLQDPDCMHLTRGNHESKNMNKLYGFEGEVLHKYDVKVYNLFCEVFCCLPLAYVLNQKVMVCHGGLFQEDNVKLDDIRKLDRFREPPESGLMCDLLWADPVKDNGRHPSKRGVSIGFGPDITKKFLSDNKLELLVRSHECKDNGYEVEADSKLITIFSAPNYCDQMKNMGAFIKFKGSDMKPQFTQFQWVDHPNIPTMAYARQSPFSF